MTSAYSRPEVQKIRSAARSEAVFNVNQTSLGATHQVCPTHNDASLKDSCRDSDFDPSALLSPSPKAFHYDGLGSLAANRKKNLFLNGRSYRSTGCGPEIVDVHS